MCTDSVNYSILVDALEPYHILVQSPEIVNVPNFLKAIPLVCIPNLLEKESCCFKWKDVSNRSKQFPSVPILYIKGAGLYQCSITCDAENIKLTSKVFHVALQPSLQGI